MSSSQKLSLVDRAYTQTRYFPQPTAGATVRLVYVIIFFPWVSSHLGVLLAPFRAAWTLHVCGATLNGSLLRVGLQENRVEGFLVLTKFVLVLSGGDLQLPGKLSGR